jgi:hypothetical protein
MLNAQCSMLNAQCSMLNDEPLRAVLRTCKFRTIVSTASIEARKNLTHIRFFPSAPEKLLP